ncbi:hypothetical protein SRHO_G00307630 [Serrasalmus rhombeus]
MVPEWVSNGVCLWQPYKSCEVIKAGRNKEQPRHGWRSYQVKLIYTADTHAEARLKLPLAENLTNSQTQDEAEEELPKKSKRRKKVYFVVFSQSKRRSWISLKSS